MIVGQYRRLYERNDACFAVNIGQAKFILVFQEGNAHTFFEKAAEVSRLQKGHPGDFTDGDGTVLIPGRIDQYRVQTA